ncbi:hypothetical protein BGZ60DRAFT_281739 [Tricladium varicosporioides]|nr:hypothetical protein BGZ60DRAFT_281739 [Hymenoscyphus varicosporioides]
MMVEQLLRWLVLELLFLVAVVSAATDQEVCGGNSHNIESQVDADNLSRCTNTTISSVTVRSTTLTSLSLSGVQRIGTLQISSCPSLIEFSAPNLVWTRNITLLDLPVLKNLSIASLETVLLGFSLNNAPNLQQPVLKVGGVNSNGDIGTNIYGDLLISSSGIQTLDNLNFGLIGKGGGITISNNPNLRLINFATLNTSNSIEISNNSPSIVVRMQSLTNADTFELRSLAEVDVPKLSTLDGSLTLAGNSFDNFTASALTAIAGDVSIANNPLLDNISLPLLKNIGGGLENGSFSISNNTNLRVVSLEMLTYVDGNTTISGDLQSVSFPKLANIEGGFHINTTSLKFNCEFFDRLSQSSAANRNSDYSCQATSPGSSEDTAIHFRPSCHGGWNCLPKASRAVLIIVFVVFGSIPFLFAFKKLWQWRRPAKPVISEPIRLDEIRAERLQHEVGDGVEPLPEYRPVGKPGEVPPAYSTDVVGKIKRLFLKLRPS